MRHQLGCGGEDDNRRGLCSEGCRTTNPGASDCEPGESDHFGHWYRGTVMLEEGPRPLGRCPVRGVAKVNQDTTIWLANSGPRSVEVAPDQVVTLVERVSESEGIEQRDDSTDTDEVKGLVRCGSEWQQLEAALHPRWHLFATNKGYLGRTDIVRHQINTGDHPTVKQRLPDGALGRGAQIGGGHAHFRDNLGE